MMFLIRSAFWLSIVYSAMPFDTAADRAVARVTAACDLACVVMPPSAIIAEGRAAIRVAKIAASANSLTAADLTPPWRGRKP